MYNTLYINILQLIFRNNHPINICLLLKICIRIFAPYLCFVKRQQHDYKLSKNRNYEVYRNIRSLQVTAFYNGCSDVHGILILRI